eukprot:gene11345-23739_t
MFDFPVYKQEGCDRPSGPYSLLFLTLLFTLSMFLLELYLDFRQLNKFRTAKRIPVELEKVVPEEKFKKSLTYGADRFSFGLIESILMFIEGQTLILMGWLPLAWDFSISLANRWGVFAYTSSQLQEEIVVTIIFVCLLTLHDTIIGLPFSLYSTFVIEQRHGFNKSTLALYVRDKLLGLGLGFVIGMPMLATVVWIIRWGGQHFYFYVWFFLCVMSMVFMLLYPTLIAPLFNKYTKLDSGPVYNAIEDLAKRVSFPLTQIFVVDGSRRSAHSNAYFYGFFKSKRIVLFDTLLTQVELPELLAILGHEIVIQLISIYLTCLPFSLYVFALFLAFSWSQNSPALFNAFGFAFTGPNGQPAAVFVGLALFTSTAWSPVDKLLNLLLNSNSRANEFAADRFSCDLGMGEELGSGLVKISIENLGNMVPDSLYSLYHFSHPPLVERLRAMRGKNQNKNKEDPNIPNGTLRTVRYFANATYKST